MNPFINFDEDFLDMESLLFLAGASGGQSVEYTAEGNPLSFTTNLAKPLKSLLLNMSPVQSGTGDPSPTNVRPISGVSAVNVVHLDENLLSINRNSSQTSNGVVFTPIKQDNKTVAVHVEGTCSGNNTFFNLNYVNGTTISIPTGVLYKVSGYTEKVGIRVFYIDAESKEKVCYSSSASPTASFMIPTDAKASWMRLQIDNGTVVNENIYPIIYAVDSPLHTYPVVFPALTKNLLSPAFLNFTDSVTVNGVTFKLNSDGSIKVSGTAPSSTTSISYYIQGKFDGNYWICDNGTIPSNADIIVYDVTHSRRCYEWDGTTSMKSITSSRQKEQVTLNDTDNIVVQLRVWNGSNPDFTFHPMLVAADETDYTYVPYSSTVYGGSLDVTTGVLTATHVGYVFTGNESMAIGSYSGTGGVRINSNCMDSINTAYNDAICNGAVKEASVPSIITKLGFRIGSGSSKLAFFVPDGLVEGETTADKFKALLVENNIMICTQLETPAVVATLTPQQITALLGDNTIWSDTNGSNTAVYYKKG